MSGDYGGPLVRIRITEEMRARALKEAKARASHTSRRMDFHAGGMERVVRCCWMGSLGEEVFAEWSASWGLGCRHRTNPIDQPDDYDFTNDAVGRIDVKTTRDHPRCRLYVRQERIARAPCEAYVLVTLDDEPAQAQFGCVEGWATRDDVINGDDGMSTSANGATQHNRTLDRNSLRPMIELIDMCFDWQTAMEGMANG